MLFASKDDLSKLLSGSVHLSNGGVRLDDADKFRDKALDTLVKNSALNDKKEDRKSVVQGKSVDLGGRRIIKKKKKKKIKQKKKQRKKKKKRSKKKNTKDKDR